MSIKEQMDKVLITLEVGGKTALLVLLDKRGQIHRKGDGNANNPTLELAQGISQQGHFDALMMTVPEDIFNHSGVIKVEPMLGNECSLTLIFNGPDGLDSSFRVYYGDQSQGPPAELVQVLINAVKLTNPWYAEQQTLRAEPIEEKKWWEFWK